MLRHHGDDFWMPEQNLTHLMRGRLAGFEPDRGRHRSTDPQVALLKVRQELATEPRTQQSRKSERSQGDDEHRYAMVKRPTQNGRVDAAQCAHNNRLGLADML